MSPWPWQRIDTTLKKLMLRYSGGSKIEHVWFSNGRICSIFEWRSVFEWSAIFAVSLGRFIYNERIILFVIQPRLKPFENRTFENQTWICSVYECRSVFESLLYSNGQYSDPHCAWLMGYSKGKMCQIIESSFGIQIAAVEFVEFEWFHSEALKNLFLQVLIKVGVHQGVDANKRNFFCYSSLSNTVILLINSPSTLVESNWLSLKTSFHRIKESKY